MSQANTAQGELSMLPSGIALGAVALSVADLDRSVTYYRDVVGLGLLDRDTTHAWLGVK